MLYQGARVARTQVAVGGVRAAPADKEPSQVQRRLACDGHISACFLQQIGQGHGRGAASVREVCKIGLEAEAHQARVHSLPKPIVDPLLREHVVVGRLERVVEASGGARAQPK